VDPIDYESTIAKNKTLLQNDPQREMLLFPHDDVSVRRLMCSITPCFICLERNVITFISLS